MNLFKSALIVLVAVTMLSAAKPAKASLGTASANPYLVVSGLAMTALGFHDAVAPYHRKFTSKSYGVFLMFFGLLQLENEDGISFRQVTQDQAAKVGLTFEETKSYNSEIEQVNALAAHVEGELEKLETPSANDSVELWENVKSAVAPETFSAMQKISVKSIK